MRLQCIMILSLLLGSVCALRAQLASNAFIIEGKIEGIDSGRLVAITQIRENDTDTLGATPFLGEDFVFLGKTGEPVFARLFLEEFVGGFSFIAEPGARYEALLANNGEAYIAGGRLNDIWRAFVKHNTGQQERLRRLEDRVEALRRERKFRSASIANDSLSLLREQIHRETDNFMRENDNVISAHTAYHNALMVDANLERSRAFYDLLGKKARQTADGQMLKGRIDRLEQTASGEVAPDFTLPTAEGKDVAFSSVKGKIKILDFWASWCGPCRLNNPTLKKVYERYHDSGLEIIGVSMDTDKEKWIDAVEEDGLNWINLSSLKGTQCPAAQLYSVRTVPTLYVIDENNVIIARNLKGDVLLKFLEDAFKK